MNYALALILVFLASCGGTPGTVRVYSIQPDKGLVRQQDKEVKAFADARGYLCESPADFRDTVTCSGGGVKVWYLERTYLLRKQTGDKRSFTSSKGYLCVSPQHMKDILDACTRPQ